MNRGSNAARLRQAGQLRAILEAIEQGRVRITGEGHTPESTARRLRERIEQLEGQR